MATVLDLVDVSVRREGSTLLHSLSWKITDAERWVVLGPNGSGKSTLLRVASVYLHPTTGSVEVLGERVGRTDVRRLRARVGLVSAALAQQLRPDLVARDVVMTARYGALEPWWHDYTDDDRARADAALGRLGVGHLATRRFGTLSSGERKRVQLARTLMADPGLILLDEPTSGLDLGGREDLVAALGALAEDPAVAPTVLVTHHTEDIPERFTHLLLLREGRIVDRGPIEEVLTATNLSDTFGLPLRLERRDGRWLCWAPRA